MPDRAPAHRELREPAAAGGWLVAIVVNVCRTQLRRTAREVLVGEPVAPRLALDTVEESVDRSALRDWVWTALERLPRASASCRRAAPLLLGELV